MPILTTTIGSYPKPSYVQVPNWFEARRTSNPNAWNPTEAYERYLQRRPPSDEALLDRATQEIVREQVEAGIEIPTDGEIRREHYIYYQCRNFSGFDFVHLTRKAMRGGSWTADVPTVINRIRKGAPILVRDWQIAQAATDRPVKITLPGPLTISDSTVNAYYEDDRELVRDLAGALNSEIRALGEAGCKWIQIDEPVFARQPDRALSLGVDALARCFHGLGAATRRAVHICCGYPSDLDLIDYPKADRRSYFLLADALESIPIDAVSIEDAHRHNDLALLECFHRTTVILGLVNIASTRVEPVEQIRGRLLEACQHIDRDRLIAAPDCGLIILGRALAVAKLRNLAEAARSIG